MYPSLAELATKFGEVQEDVVVIILSPDTVLTLYPDWTSTLETSKTYQIMRFADE